jgi:hypothetical protein
VLEGQVEVRRDPPRSGQEIQEGAGKEPGIKRAQAKAEIPRKLLDSGKKLKERGRRPEVPPIRTKVNSGQDDFRIPGGD